MTPADRDDHEADVDRAADILADGGVVAFPTETVYGLGADAANPAAVGRVFAIKGRPADHPVIVHLAGPDAIDGWAAEVPAGARRLAERLWPGPLTLVLRRRPRVPDVVTGGRDTVGLRVPDHPVALALLAAMHSRVGGGAALAAPSANRFGHVSPTTGEHVRADLGDEVDLVLDGGPCRVGVESTIVDFTLSDPEVLRLGGTSLEQLAEDLGSMPVVASPDAARARAPGTLPSHYAPSATVVIVEAGPDLGGRLGERLRGLGAPRAALLAPVVVADLPPDVVELEPAGPADDYARVLYDRLRQADRLGVEVVVAVPPPPGGLGDAVRDRLSRAAHGRGSA